MSAKFSNLVVDESYDIIDGESGHWRTQGIQGAEAMATEWNVGDEAWPENDTEFRGKPIDVAK